MTYTKMIPLCAFVSLIACNSASREEPTLGEAREPLVSTYYEGDWWGRNVYARKFDPQGAPRVRFNGKSGGQCVATEERAMVPVPQSDITASLCASLGAEAKFVAGKVVGCVSTSTQTPVGVWKYHWFDASLREVNYEVIDQGAGGQILDSSGWVPTPGNGCPR